MDNTGDKSIDIVTDVTKEIIETEAPLKQREEDGIKNDLVDVGEIARRLGEEDSSGTSFSCELCECL